MASININIEGKSLECCYKTFNELVKTNITTESSKECEKELAELQAEIDKLKVSENEEKIIIDEEEEFSTENKEKSCFNLYLSLIKKFILPITSNRVYDMDSDKMRLWFMEVTKTTISHVNFKILMNNLKIKPYLMVYDGTNLKYKITTSNKVIEDKKRAVYYRLNKTYADELFLNKDLLQSIFKLYRQYTRG